MSVESACGALELRAAFLPSRLRCTTEILLLCDGQVDLCYNMPEQMQNAPGLVLCSAGLGRLVEYLQMSTRSFIEPPIPIWHTAKSDSAADGIAKLSTSSPEHVGGAFPPCWLFACRQGPQENCMVVNAVIGPIAHSQCQELASPQLLKNHP